MAQTTLHPLSTKLAPLPDHVPADLVYDFDFIGDRLFAKDAPAGLARLAAEAPPVFYTRANGGHWVIAAPKLMEEVSRSDHLFDSARSDIPNSVHPQRLIPTNLDRPANLPFRMLLLRRLGPKAVKDLEERVRVEARQRIAGLRASGKCELVADFAAPLPATVFMEQAGMPLERRTEFQGLIHATLQETDREKRDAVTARIIGIVTGMLEARLDNPPDDIFGDIVKARVDGRALTMGEMQSMGYLLFLAGLDTVVSGIVYCLWQLGQRPDLQERLAADPSLIPRFVEEVLRLYGIAPNYRHVKNDTRFAGVEFRKGDMLICMLPISGLDPAINPDPLAFDLDREKPSHLAFSTGPHSCLGQVLARMEMKVAVEEWLRQIPRFEVAEDSLAPNGHGGAVIGFEAVTLGW